MDDDKISYLRSVLREKQQNKTENKQAILTHKNTNQPNKQKREKRQISLYNNIAEGKQPEKK